jgi:hypothetical protein
MNDKIKELKQQALRWSGENVNRNLYTNYEIEQKEYEKFAELIVRECVNREALLGAIARGWCSEKNSHKTMDSDLAVAIFDEVEQQIRQQFGVE